MTTFDWSPISDAMNATVPNFFFSYSHADWDAYLERFFVNLRDLVAQKSGIDNSEFVAFRDQDNVKNRR